MSVVQSDPFKRVQSCLVQSDDFDPVRSSLVQSSSSIVIQNQHVENLGCCNDAGVISGDHHSGESLLSAPPTWPGHMGTLGSTNQFMMLVDVCVCLKLASPLCHQVLQVLAWVVSTVLLKFLLSTLLGAADDVRPCDLTSCQITTLLRPVKL